MRKKYDDILVSVCIPTYNSALYIERTIRSVLNQTHENIELIICDDCSTDNTVEKIKKFNDERIRLYVNEINLGIAGNWNKCLNVCTGKYIKLICADDVIALELIEEEIKILEKYPDVVMVESDTVFIDSVNRQIGKYNRHPGGPILNGTTVAMHGILCKDYFGAPVANTFRRSSLKQVHGFDRAFKYILDYDFFMRLAFTGNIYVIHQPMNYFRLRDSSNTDKVLSTDSKVYLEEHKMLLKKNKDKLNLNTFTYHLSVLIRMILTAGSKVYIRSRKGK